MLLKRGEVVGRILEIQENGDPEAGTENSRDGVGLLQEHSRA